jgi:serine/threonine protein kinase
MGKALSMLVEVQLHQSVYHGDSDDVAGEGGLFKVTGAPVMNSAASSSSAPQFNVVKFPNAVGVADGWASRLEALLCELRVLTARPVLKHPNITQLRELSWKAAPYPQNLMYPGLLLERALFGNLFDFQQPAVFSLTSRVKIGICRDIAVALAFLHACGVAHSDVKPENVLLFPSDGAGPVGYPVAKLADFSHAVFECDAKDGLIRWRGYTAQWAAPEILERSTQSAELIFYADIYSYGLLFWHVLLDGIDIFSLLPPNAKFAEDEVLSAALSSLQNAPKDLNLPLVQQVLELCLQREEGQRANSMNVLVNILEDEIRRSDR